MPALRSEAQKLASRLNGQKSQGPKTAEGKAISARNAIKHGLNSGSVVLWCEKKEKYLEYLEDLTGEWQPESITELELVTALADAQWQLKRLTAIRTASIDLEMDRAEKSFREDFPASDETTRLALAWQALAVESRSLAELNRHEAHLRRIVDRSISKLLAIGEARLRSEQQHDHHPQHENAKNEPDTPTGGQQQSAAATIIPITSRPAVTAGDDLERQRHQQRLNQIHEDEPEPVASTGDNNNRTEASNCGNEPGAGVPASPGLEHAGHPQER